MQPLTKRQREILDYLNDFIQQHGYAPSLEEIGRRFGLVVARDGAQASRQSPAEGLHQAVVEPESVARIACRRGRSLARSSFHCLGYVAAGAPIEAIVGAETIEVPETLVGKRDTYVLRVRGNSMIDEQIRDGDLVIVEDRKTAENGETVVALVSGRT